MNSARDSRSRIGIGLMGGLVLGSLFGGCATAPRIVMPPPSLSAELSPAPVAVSPGEVWRRAEAYARANPGSQVMIGRGGSMLPQYEDRTVLVVQSMPQSELRKGMTVVFVGDAGRPVAHTLIAPSPQGWVAMGMGNAAPDRTPVRYGNYVGTVIGAFVPRSALAEAQLIVEMADSDRIAVLE